MSAGIAKSNAAADRRNEDVKGSRFQGPEAETGIETPLVDQPELWQLEEESRPESCSSKYLRA
jgi:hypothetical protein